jgi:hypothetical protein
MKRVEFQSKASYKQDYMMQRVNVVGKTCSDNADVLIKSSFSVVVED